MSTTVLFSKGDLVLNEATRQPYMISGRSKGVQDIIFTLQAREPYGAGFRDRFGIVPESGPAFAADLTFAAREVIENLQLEQGQYQAEAYTADELVDRINAVRVVQVPDDPTTYRFLVRVQLGTLPVIQVAI